MNDRPGIPGRGVVAGGACARRWETRTGMVRNGSAKSRGALPLSRVATVTIGRRHSGSEVAKVAGHGDVRTGQRETGGAMVKNRARPGGRCVARVACLWIRKGHVVWGWRNIDRGGSALIKGIVATVASRRQRSGIVTVYMALRAGDSCCMRPRQREGCRAVIESGGRPICRRVADGTIRGEACGNMIWNRGAGEVHGAVPVGQMAPIASG